MLVYKEIFIVHFIATISIKLGGSNGGDSAYCMIAPNNDQFINLLVHFPVIGSRALKTETLWRHYQIQLIMIYNSFVQTFLTSCQQQNIIGIYRIQNISWEI